MSTILFYSPFNHRSRDTESLMIAFRQQGHRVISLSQAEGHQIHFFLQAHNVETHSYVITDSSRWRKHVRHIYYLVTFCWRNKVDVVYSHLESANFIACFAQFFVRPRVIICRHHSDQFMMLGRDHDLSYKITYWLAKKIIVFSEAAKSFMISQEGVPPRKIIHINLAYDFSLYRLDTVQAEEIRRKLNAQIVLAIVCNFNPLKRPADAIHVLHALVNEGLDVKLIMLGDGEQEALLRKIIGELNLEESVLLPGYVSNVLDYLSASTFLLHPSFSESSCVVVKEAGLVRLPVIVCRGVGDFNDYIVHGKNGFLVDSAKFIEEAVEIIKLNYRNKKHLEDIGINLRESVIERFSIENVIGEYDALNNPTNA